MELILSVKKKRWKNPKVDNRIISDKNNVNACTLMSKIYFKTVET